MSYVIGHSLILHYLASASLALHLFLGPNHTYDCRESLDAQTIETPYIRVTFQTYDTEYVVCHRSFSHPPLFSISFVGASYFVGTQLYVGLSGEFGCANDWNTIRPTSNFPDLRHRVCRMSSVILSSSIVKHQLRWRIIFSWDRTIRRIIERVWMRKRLKHHTTYE